VSRRDTDLVLSEPGAAGSVQNFPCQLPAQFFLQSYG
jgi:hypothetical protein